MGLFDWVGGLLSKNDYEGMQPVKLDEFNFLDQLKNSFANQNDFLSGVGGGADQAKQLNQMLMQAASGEGPSVASVQGDLKQAQTNQALASTLASGKGMTPALAAKLASRAAASQSGENALGTRIAQNQERLGAMEALGGNLLNMANAQTNRLGTLGNLNNAQNQVRSGNYIGANTIGQNAAQQNTAYGQGLAQSFMGSGINALSGGGKAYGGEIQPMAGGGEVYDPGVVAQGPGAYQNNFLAALDKARIGEAQEAGAGIGSSGASGLKKLFSSSGGGAGAAPTSAGGKMSGAALSNGGPVPGQAQVQGDSYANDTVPTMLSPGEIVIPRSKTDPEDAKRFVEEIQKKKEKESVNFGHVLHANRVLHERLANLERMAYGGICG
jgi:hypothetical protein